LLGESVCVFANGSTTECARRTGCTANSQHTGEESDAQNRDGPCRRCGAVRLDGHRPDRGRRAEFARHERVHPSVGPKTQMLDCRGTIGGMGCGPGWFWSDGWREWAGRRRRDDGLRDVTGRIHGRHCVVVHPGRARDPLALRRIRSLSSRSETGRPPSLSAADYPSLACGITSCRSRPRVRAFVPAGCG